MIQANPDSDSPAPFFVRGYLPLTAPPNNFYDLRHPDSPPLDRQGGGVETSINSNGQSAWLLLILRWYALSFPCAPGDGPWQARELVCRCCVWSILLFSSRDNRKKTICKT